VRSTRARERNARRWGRGPHRHAAGVVRSTRVPAARCERRRNARRWGRGPHRHAAGVVRSTRVPAATYQGRLKHHCGVAAAWRPWAAGQNTIEAQCRPGLRSAKMLPFSGRSSIW